jgi:PTS system fructose-specific IIA component
VGLSREKSVSSQITVPSIVVVGTHSTTKDEVVRELGALLVAEGRVSELEGYVEAVKAREEHFPTGIEGGVAIPHAQTPLVTEAAVAVATSQSGIDFGADDGPAHLIFLIAAPQSSENLHLEILANLARRIMHEEFRDSLRNETDPSRIAEIITQEVTP